MHNKACPQRPGIHAGHAFVGSAERGGVGTMNRCSTLVRSVRGGVGHTTRWLLKLMSSRHRVLIADETGAETWAAYLSDLDCDTKVAASAELLDDLADWQPDLVVLDPMGCGFDLCRQIKQGVSTPNTMVLMVTQLNELADVERAIEAGTDEFLSKPVNKTEFVKRVEHLLKLSRL